MITLDKLRLFKVMITQLDYPYFEKYYKSIAIDLSKQRN